jgi:hypothetical protein
MKQGRGNDLTASRPQARAVAVAARSPKKAGDGTATV